MVFYSTCDHSFRGSYVLGLLRVEDYEVSSCIQNAIKSPLLVLIRVAQKLCCMQ